MVEKIQDAVVSYYGQFEDQMDLPQPAATEAEASPAPEIALEPAEGPDSEVFAGVAAANGEKSNEEEPGNPIESDTIKDAE